MPDFERETKLRAMAAVVGSIVAILPAILIPILGPIGFLCLVLNFAAGYFIVKAKIQYIKRTKDYTAFGSGKMLSHERRRYILGYLLLASSVGIMLWQIYF